MVEVSFFLDWMQGLSDLICRERGEEDGKKEGKGHTVL